MNETNISDEKGIYNAIATIYNEQIESLNSNTDHQYMTKGYYNFFDEISEKIVKSKENTLTQKVKKYAKKFAVPVASGALIATGSEIYQGAEYSLELLNYARDGALVGLISSTSIHFIGKSIANKVLKKPISYVKKTANELYNEAKEELPEKHSSVLRYMNEYLTNNEFNTKISILTYIKNHGEEKKNISVASALWTGLLGGIKYTGAGFAFNIISPINADLSFLSSIGATENITNYGLKQLPEKWKRDCEKTLNKMTKKQKDKLVGGLIKHWYGITEKENIPLTLKADYKIIN